MEEAPRLDPLHVTVTGSLGIAVGVAILLAGRSVRPAPPYRVAPPGRAALAGGLYAFAFLPLLVGIVLLMDWIKGLSGGERKPQFFVDLALHGSEADFLAIAAFAVLAAPFAEEVVFRGPLYGGLRARLGRLGATLASAAAFAAIHMEKDNLDALPPIFVLALFLCDLRERTGGLTAPIAMHATYNGLQMLVIYSSRGGGG